ncbi:hypothetical protein [Paraburkholderia sp. C35]|uniref:hypothetical protein n=1 Tax=Paraburkholderia sp. C35 TaxID=2126993 RepID=UPI000D6916E8|nr:hypothetical protein [Paraburkholderia sp. C35]
MAIKKPSWDMDIREIDRRAADLKRVDDYFKAQRLEQARADAAARADAVRPVGVDRETDMQIDSIVGRYWEADRKSLTAAGVDYAVKHGTIPPENARTDSVSRDGLVETITIDRTGREVSTFRSVDGRKRWMDPYRATAGLMVNLNKDPAYAKRKMDEYFVDHPEAIKL